MNLLNKNNNHIIAESIYSIVTSAVQLADAETQFISLISGAFSKQQQKSFSSDLPLLSLNY